MQTLDNPESPQSAQQTTAKFNQGKSAAKVADIELAKEELDQYFLKVFSPDEELQTSNQKRSGHYIFERFARTTEHLCMGYLEIGSQESIENLLEKEQLTPYEQKQFEQKIKKELIAKQLEELEKQTSVKAKNNKLTEKSPLKSQTLIEEISEIDDMHAMNAKLVLSRKEHQDKVKKMVVEREAREKKRQEESKKAEENKKRLKQIADQAEAERALAERQKKHAEIQAKLQKKREEHEAFLRKEKMSEAEYKELKKKKFLHEKIEQRFHQSIRMPLLEQQKRSIREKRDFSKAYSIDAIKNHEKSYLQLRESILQQSNMKKSQALKQTQQNYKAPPKSTRLQKILEEEKLNNKKEMMEKKLAIEEKIHRRDNYIEYLKEKFVPKISEAKRDEIRARLEQESNRRKHIDLDQKTLGMNYLEEAKRKRRKPHSSHTHNAQSEHSVEHQEGASSQEQKNLTVLSESKSREPRQTMSRFSDKSSEERQKLLLHKRQEMIHNLIADESINPHERIMKLKAQTDKINEAFKMKEEMLKYGGGEKVQDEAVELLLMNIEAKMGIIDIKK